MYRTLVYCFFINSMRPSISSDEAAGGADNAGNYCGDCGAPQGRFPARPDVKYADIEPDHASSRPPVGVHHTLRLTMSRRLFLEAPPGLTVLCRRCLARRTNGILAPPRLS
jgi:hypothetical protein